MVVLSVPLARPRPGGLFSLPPYLLLLVSLCARCVISLAVPAARDILMWRATRSLQGLVLRMGLSTAGRFAWRSLSYASPGPLHILRSTFEHRVQDRVLPPFPPLLRLLPCSPLLLLSSLACASGFRQSPVSLVVLHFAIRRPTVVWILEFSASASS